MTFISLIEHCIVFTVLAALSKFVLQCATMHEEANVIPMKIISILFLVFVSMFFTYHYLFDV